MRVLVACEESQVVALAFRDAGHEAYSCDILATSGPKPEFHLQQDVTPLLKERWDLVIAFPPCTDLAVSGARWFPEKRKNGSQARSIAFFNLFTDLPHIPNVAIENPVGIMSSIWKKPSQIIQPWMFGHGETKATCLWLKGLPLLTPTEVVSGRKAYCHRLPPSPDRARLRSKTYPGVAKAMAEQWGEVPK